MIVYGCFFRVYKNCQAELRRELVTGYTIRLYEQLETSPETIEQEFRGITTLYSSTRSPIDTCKPLATSTI